MANNIGKQLASLRKEKGYTQKQVAEMLNISNKTLSSWEVGNTMPDLIMLPKIADIYEVSCDELLREDNIYEYSSTHSSDSFSHNDITSIDEEKNYDIQIAVTRVKKMNAVYAVYILLYIFIIPLTLTMATFTALTINNHISYIWLALPFAGAVLILYITGVALNCKTFRLSQDSTLVNNFKNIRYKFAMSNLCIIISSMIMAYITHIMPISLSMYIFPLAFYFSVAGIIALIFIYADKKIKIKKSQEEQQQIHKKSFKTFRTINKISGGALCVILIIMCTIIGILFAQTTKERVYKTYTNYTEAIEQIQQCSDISDYVIISKEYNPKNSFFEICLAPQEGHTLSRLNIEDKFGEYDYDIKDNNTFVLKLNYLILDTPDGKINYYVANPSVIDGGKIVVNKDGTYSIHCNNDPFSTGLSQLFLIFIGAFLTFIFISISVLCTIISTIIYDSRYYKKRQLKPLQKTA